jgi:hypothetical protein
MNKFHVIKVFDAVTIPAGGHKDSMELDLADKSGDVLVQYEVTGDGTLEIEGLHSLNRVEFLQPDGAAGSGTLLSGLTKTSGRGGAGKGWKQAALTSAGGLGCHAKLRVTETGSANSATISLWLAVR